jgi:hypothetical protein
MKPAPWQTVQASRQIRLDNIAFIVHASDR